MRALANTSRTHAGLQRDVARTVDGLLLLAARSELIDARRQVTQPPEFRCVWVRSLGQRLVALAEAGDALGGRLEARDEEDGGRPRGEYDEGEGGHGHNEDDGDGETMPLMAMTRQ